MGHILEWPAELLDGDILLGGRVVGRAHDALGPRPDGFEVLVALKNCESRVAHLDRVEMRARLAGHAAADILCRLSNVEDVDQQKGETGSFGALSTKYNTGGN